MIFPLITSGPTIGELPVADVISREFGFWPEMMSKFSLKVSVTRVGAELRIAPLLGLDETRVEWA